MDGDRVLYQTTTQADGTYAFSGLAEGTYTLRIRVSGKPKHLHPGNRFQQQLSHSNWKSDNTLGRLQSSGILLSQPCP